jgi:hypothetical protein
MIHITTITISNTFGLRWKCITIPSPRVVVRMVQTGSSVVPTSVNAQEAAALPGTA